LHIGFSCLIMVIYKSRRKQESVVILYQFICEKCRFKLFLVSVFATFLASFALSSSVFGIAKQSTLSVDYDTDLLSITMVPTVDGKFEKSVNSTLGISTDNFTGYTLSVEAATSSTSLVDEENHEITSISSSVSETDFTNSSTYNNKWGFKPSQYITTNNNVNTIVQNSDYLPAPTTSGLVLDVTSAANATDNTYDFSFGARVNQDMPTGTYTYTLIFRIVPNAITYNVTYNNNTSETVTNMPLPNPQALTIDGGTPTAQSYAELSSAVPTMTSADMSFDGWCDVATTVDPSTGDYLCSGNTYDAGDDYPIDQTTSATNITLYAIWINDSFPMVWSQMGACEFHAATNGNITGTECQQYANDKFIDTEIALYSAANYKKDYEVHFTIDHYVPSENDGLADQQQTFVSDKLSSSVSASPYDGKAPGMIVRRSGNDIQIRSTSGHSSSSSSEIIVPSNTADISIYRLDGVIYASINHGSLQQIQNISSFDQQFGLNTWFGAYPGDDCTGNTTDGVCTNAIRYIEATLSNMYIRLGDFGETIHHVTFNGNGGTPTTTTYAVIDGDTLGTLPTATRTNYVLMYWYTTSGGSSIATPETQPHGDATYYAFWLKEVSQAQISNSSITLPVDGTETINVTNSAELEEYTFSSNDDSVATVNSATGLVTAVDVGTATITMTGTKSHTTKTISVTVSDSMARVTFDAGQGSSVDPIDVEIGETISELPISIRSGYTLEGWYTGANGTGTKLTTSLTIDDDMEFIANWIVTTNVCRLADPTALHTETCARTSAGCRISNNYANGATITYGKVPQDSTLVPGIAYTCDINANNEYDEQTERFYYLGTNSGNAVLVWYKNISDVSINYDAAYALLPDSNTWRNTNLIAQANDKVTRYMKESEVKTACGGSANGLKTKQCDYLMEKSNFANTNMIDGIWLEKINSTTSGGRRIHSTGLSLGNVNPNTGGSNNAPRPVIEIPMNMLEIWSSPDYTITFNPHNGTSSWDETVTAGDDLSAVYPTNDPTYNNHIFQGWYTSESGGTLVTSSTEPSSSTTYHAQWLGTVALASVVNDNISVPANNTATVTVTNSADLEGFSFSSSDTSVATIHPSTGVITPFTTGTTNISITGASSHTTNQIATVTVTQAVTQYTITFNPHNGTATWDETVNAGSALGNAYPATDPIYTNHVFQGWYTADSGGTLVTSSTEPSSSTTYHAQWLGSVALATFDSNSITVQEGNTATITVTNSAQIENYSFASLDSTVAMVDTTTGVVTGVNAGTTSIRMTGAGSQTYVDIPVTVTAITPATYTVYFEPHNGSSSTSVTVTAGSEIGSSNIPADPSNSDPDQIFMGWFTAANGGTAVNGSTVPTANNETYHAQYKKIVCRLETSSANLHTATRADDGTTQLTYGQIANNTTPQAGDAYNCDVDYDDTYSAVNERFYFVSQDASNNAVLVAWNSYYNGAWAAGTSNDSIFSYTAALSELPANTSGAWDNPGLVEQETGKAARFTAREEIASACGKTLSQMNATDSLLVCDYFMEHSAYDGGGRSALWLMKEDTTQYRIHSGSTNRHISTSSSGSSMVRPAIVVPYKLIEKYTPAASDVTNAVIANNDLTVQVGHQLTIQVSNSASLEPYTFSSDDASIATVNSSTGVVSGVSVGTVDIIMTGTTSGLTKTIEVEVVSDPDTPVVFDVSNDATRGYKAIVNQWVQSPVGITTFNQASPINSSTWGDTSELSEAQYWSTLKNNFETNDCKVTSYIESVTTTPNPTAWANGSTNCGKPDAYDTTVNAPVNVYLYNNQTLGAQVAYTDSSTGVIHNLIPGNTYKWIKDGDSSVYGYVTVKSNGSDHGTRWIDAGTIGNVRDLGGLPADTDGDGTVDAYVNYGKLFRGEKLGSESASKLTNLGITEEINVGDEYSSDTHLSNYDLLSVIHYEFEYHADDELDPTSNYMKAWNAVTRIMRDVTSSTNPQNIYFHCRVGADRTGTVAYLLEGLLGVPNEERYQEYSLTHLSGLYDRTRYYKLKASNNANKFVYMMGYVKTNAQILEWYNHNPAASADLIANFKAAMTTSISGGNGGNGGNNLAPAAQSSPLSVNNNGGNVINNNSNSTEEPEDDSESGHIEPLGVTESHLESAGSNESPAAVDLIVATAAVGVAGTAITAAAVKQHKDNESN